MNRKNKTIRKTSMKKTIAVRVGAFVAGAVTGLSGFLLEPTLNGQTPPNYSWTKTDEYQYVPGLTSIPFGMTSDPSGNVYVVGSGHTNAPANLQITHGLIRQLSPSGGPWRLVSDFAYAPGKDSAFMAIAAGSSTK